MKKFLVLIILLIYTPAFAQTYIVNRVIDGDTLQLTNGEMVRLIGIDTPESNPNQKAQKDRLRTGKDLKTITTMGQESTKFVQNLFYGRNVKNVILEYDVGKKDRFGRKLSYLYFLTCPKGALCKPSPDYFYEIEKDGSSYLFLNATIIKAGYASPMTIPPNVMYADLFQKLYQEARSLKRGLWK